MRKGNFIKKIIFHMPTRPSQQQKTQKVQMSDLLKKGHEFDQCLSHQPLMMSRQTPSAMIIIAYDVTILFMNMQTFVVAFTL